jgi:hypothetical protein
VVELDSRSEIRTRGGDSGDWWQSHRRGRRHRARRRINVGGDAEVRVRGLRGLITGICRGGWGEGVTPPQSRVVDGAGGWSR